jgi:hypothetical protein
VGQAVSAWLGGRIAMTADELIDHLASLLDHLADPAAYRR